MNTGKIKAKNRLEFEIYVHRETKLVGIGAEIKLSVPGFILFLISTLLGHKHTQLVLGLDENLKRSNRRE